MDEELGQATVVYESPDADEDPIERSLDNENVAYFQDHWFLKIDERDGDDVVQRIPAQRVYYVERTVEEFEEEVATLRNQLESFAGNIRETQFESLADNLRETILGGRGNGQDDSRVSGERHLDSGEEGAGEGGAFEDEPHGAMAPEGSTDDEPQSIDVDDDSDDESQSRDATGSEANTR